MFRQYRPIEAGEAFVIAADTSSGVGDYCAAQFISKTKIDVPLVYHEKTIATNMTNILFPLLERLYEKTNVKPTIAYERNNGGNFEMERLASMNRLGKFEIFKMPTIGRENPPDGVRYGWDTNTATRPAMLGQLKEAIDNKVLRIYDKPTIEEMYSFIVVTTSTARKAQAEAGFFDDLVMSLAIAWQLYQTVPTQDPEEQMQPNDFTQYTNIW